MDALRRFFRVSFFSFKGMFLFLSPITYFTVLILSPISSLVFFVLIARDAYGPTADIRQCIIGNSLILCYVSAFFCLGNILGGEREFGTLKVFISSPNCKFYILLSKGFLFIVNGLVTVFLGLIVGRLLFGHVISITFSFIICIIIAVFSVASMGFFISTIGLLTRDANLILNIWNMIFMAVCGINYSTSLLPLSLQYLSNFLPLKHTMDAISKLLLGRGDIMPDLLKELAVCLCYFCLAVIALALFEKLARKYSTLDFF